MTKKFLLSISVLVLVTIGSLLFIQQSNDHKECTTVTVNATAADGNIVETQKHNCNEKFNF